jgi:CRP-like cAMP-binding protein
MPTNRLLASLSGRRRLDFLASCDQVELDFAQTLCSSGERIRQVYFPLGSFISLITVLDQTAKLEVGVIGNEGMLGISLTLGIETSPQQAMVQGGGSALRMSTAAFHRQSQRNPAFRQDLGRYVHVLMSQLAQTAACTHYHRLEGRLARWLLLTRDRAHCDEFRLTHEFLAYMLGVRRGGVTLAASALQARGLISYSRGVVVILDSRGLESASCQCYRRGNAMYERALGKQRRKLTQSD